jgi:hypothetical protein
MLRKTLLFAALALTTAGGCASGGEVCRDRGDVVKCRPVEGGPPLERCHRNWRGALICRAP